MLGAAGEAPYVRVRTIEDGKLGPERTLSRPELGPVAPELGFDVAADRASGAVVAWVQGGAEDRRIVAGYLDRPPGFFAGYTSQRCCQPALARLSWQPAFNLWGPVRYVVTVDGKPVGETTETRAAAHGAARGRARTAGRSSPFDARGQSKRARTRTRARRRPRAVAARCATSARGASCTLSVRARDIGVPGAPRTGRALGRRVVGRPARRARRARRPCAPRIATARGGSYPLQITATDRAGNQRTSLRTVRIRLAVRWAGRCRRTSSPPRAARSRSARGRG